MQTEQLNGGRRGNPGLIRGCTVNTETINDRQRWGTPLGGSNPAAERRVARHPSMGGVVATAASNGLLPTPSRPPSNDPARPTWYLATQRGKPQRKREGWNRRTPVPRLPEKARLFASQLVAAAIYLIVKALHASLILTVPYLVLNFFALWS